LNHKNINPQYFQMSLAKIIDHTILRPDCTLDDVKKVCEEAKELGFATVCVPPYYVKHVKRALRGSSVNIATVVGFPMGYCTIPAKVEEIKRAISDGAHEVDVVINIAAVKSRDWSYLENELESVTRMTHLKGKVVKLILETGLLNEEEVLKLCQICKKVEPDFVKTSTGFHSRGASVTAVSLLRANLPRKIKIKASGGIRTFEDAQRMIDAGAERLGCSASITILKGQPQ